MVQMGGTMSKLETNKKRKMDALLENALELFTTKGLQETSISDIVKKAGVAKGTFYLYFKDKYDLRNILIAHESSKIFMKAAVRLEKSGILDFEEKIIFLVNDIIEQLNQDKKLLLFISKNLGWGYFKSALVNSRNEDDVDFYMVYQKMLKDSEHPIKEPEIMLFMIVELVSSTCYSSILYNEPVSLSELKPYLFANIRNIMASHFTQL